MVSVQNNTNVELSPANLESTGLSIVGLPSDGQQGDGLVGGRLSSLDESDVEIEGIASDVSTIYSRNPSVGGASVLLPSSQVNCIKCRHEEVGGSDDFRRSEDKAEFALGANGGICHPQY
ncbi:unnamed protein product [Peronospora belbahrii]|nr:unnamed protein product [Peronospora belbahrii]